MFSLKANSAFPQQLAQSLKFGFGLLGAATLLLGALALSFA